MGLGAARGPAAENMTVGAPTRDASLTLPPPPSPQPCPSTAHTRTYLRHGAEPWGDARPRRILSVFSGRPADGFAALVALSVSRRRDRRGARRPEPRRHAGRRARADPQRAAQRRLRRRARRDAVHVLLGGARQPRGRPRAPRPSHVRARERPAGRVGDGQRVRAQARSLRRLHHRLGQRRVQPRPQPRHREPSASR